MTSFQGAAGRVWPPFCSYVIRDLGKMGMSIAPGSKISTLMNLEDVEMAERPLNRSSYKEYADGWEMTGGKRYQRTL